MGEQNRLLTLSKRSTPFPVISSGCAALRLTGAPLLILTNHQWRRKSPFHCSAEVAATRCAAHRSMCRLRWPSSGFQAVAKRATAALLKLF